jgi:hypothetical protein
MNTRGQYGNLGHGQGRVQVGAFLVHTLELKQRYNNVKTAAVQSLLNELSSVGSVLSTDTNRWEIALKEGTWVQLTWHPDASALEITITDRELRPVDQLAATRGRYETLLNRLTPQLQRFGATTVGAAIVGQTPTPRLAARTRALRAVFDMYTHTRAPYYIYAEVNGVINKQTASSIDEANAIFASLEHVPGEVYVAIFDPTDPLWPGPSFDVYNAVPQLPQDRSTIAGRSAHSRSSYVGQGSIFGHTPGDVENELDQLHNEMMGFGQQLIELVKKEEDQARALVQKERDEELAAWNVVESFQPQVNEVYRIEKLLNQAGVDKKITARWREESIPPYADIVMTGLGKNDGLKQQFIAAMTALDKVMPRAQRIAAIKRSRELTDRRSEAELKRQGEFPLSQWRRSTWDPFFAGWMKFRSEKKDIPLQTWPLSGTWDRIQDYRTQFGDLYKKTPFKPSGPRPLDPDRKDPSITGGIEELLKYGKYAIIGVLGIGAVVALSSVASNLRTGKDPGEKYMELIRARASRVPRAPRALPKRAQLALPPGEDA